MTTSKYRQLSSAESIVEICFLTIIYSFKSADNSDEYVESKLGLVGANYPRPPLGFFLNFLYSVILLSLLVLLVKFS